MNNFPAVDPIPLPAPVWLFKALHILTMALHFYAVELLIGGLLIAVLLNLMGVMGRGSAISGVRLGAAASLAKRLPIVMTYVINLGVPPLLFSQVLYGRALYTSSVLIGAYWIAVIPMLMACYWLLYKFNAGAERGRPVWWIGALSWLIAGSIAKILSTNMTLMLRPEVWQQMYSATAGGTHLPPHDPTTSPRWLFMLAGGLVFAGLWMVWLAGHKRIEMPVREYLAGLGGRVAVAGVIAQLAAGHFVYHLQPAKVLADIAANPFYHLSSFVWIGSVALILVFGAWVGFKKVTAFAAGWVGATLGFLALAGWTIFRDGVRDYTLLGKGYDVWQRTVVTNWSVVGLFLLLFVIGLGTIGWLVSVMVRAKPVTESVVK